MTISMLAVAVLSNLPALPEASTPDRLPAPAVVEVADWELAAQAQSARPDAQGPYAKLFGGVGLVGDEDIEFDDGAGGFNNGDGEFDVGFLGGAALGWRFNEAWSVELEYAYRTNDVDSFDSGGATLADGGDYASTTWMVNGYYHFDTDWKLEPYVGLGFGYTDEIDIDLEGPGFAGEQSFSGSSPSAQWIIGGRTELTEALDLHVEGRWFRAFDPDMDGEGNPGNVESEYGHLALTAGVSYSF